MLPYSSECTDLLPASFTFAIYVPQQLHILRVASPTQKWENTLICLNRHLLRLMKNGALVGEKKSHPYSSADRCNRGNTTCWPYKWLLFLISREKMREMATQELQQHVHNSAFSTELIPACKTLMYFLTDSAQETSFWNSTFSPQAFRYQSHQDLISSTLDQNSPSPCKSAPGNIFMLVFSP